MTAWWVELWSRKEDPVVLAVVRILVALVVLWDLCVVAQLDLVVGLWGDVTVGGIANIADRPRVPWVYQVLPVCAETAWGLWATAVGASVCLMLGLGSRLASLILVLVLAQLAQVLPAADRGIDMLLRNVLCIFVFADVSSALSLPSWYRTRRLMGRTVPEVGSWPRYLLIVQLALVYGCAGASKVSTVWLPMGEWSALYLSMRDPAFATMSDELLRASYGLTQVATLCSWLWEWAAPLWLLSYHYRETADRSGRLRALCNRVRFLEVYVVMGACFHLGTHVTLRLGVFPFAMLALYPACFHPRDWSRWYSALSSKFRQRLRPAQTGSVRGADG